MSLIKRNLRAGNATGRHTLPACSQLEPTSSEACCARPSCSRRESASSAGELDARRVQAGRGQGRRRGPDAPGGRRARRRHGRRDAAALVPEPAPGGRRRVRRLGPRRVPLGRVALGRARRPDGRAPADRASSGKLRRRRSLSGEELAYARGRTDRVLKVTLPSPSLFANFYDPERSRDAYPTLEEFLGDVAEILREEVEELVDLGATYVQLDAPHYPLLLDPGYRDFYESRGWPADSWLELGLELDNHRHRRPSRRDVRLPPLPREPGEPLARLGRLRLARRPPLPPRERAAAPARVRRRALRRLRAARRRCPRTRSACSAS